MFISVFTERQQIEAKLGADLSSQKDEFKELVTKIYAETQTKEESEAEDDGEDDSDGSEVDPKKKGGDETSWSLSDEMKEFLGVEDAAMSFKEVWHPHLSRGCLIISTIILRMPLTKLSPGAVEGPGLC